MAKDQSSKPNQFFFKPATGTVLAVLAGFSFFLLSMMLSLVGPAGSRVDHADKNRAAFLAVLVITLILSVAAAYAKMGCRKEQGGSLPWFSFGLCAVCVLSLITLLFNGFAI